MTTVVTGASGHIGACLVRALLGGGRTVRTIDMEHGEALEGLDIETHIGDIRDGNFLRSLFHQGDVVYHLASVISTTGDKNGLLYSVNVDGAREVALACLDEKVERLVHFSSVHAYDIDTHGTPVTEETRLATANSRSDYSLSKAKGQEAVLEVVKLGLNAVVVNPCGVIGPYDYKTSRMGEFFRKIARGRKDPMSSGGFNWVDVRDVVDGALLAEEKGQIGECYILGGHWVTNAELGKIAGRISGQEVPENVIPIWGLILLQKIGVVQSKLTNKQPRINRDQLDALRANRDISSDKAKREFNYTPRPTEDTVAAIYDWLNLDSSVDRP